MRLKSIIPGVDWPALPNARGCQLLALQFQLERSQWFSPDAIADARVAMGAAILSESSSMSPMSSSSGGEGGTLDIQDTEVNEGGVARFNVKFNAEYFNGCSATWETQDGSATGSSGTCGDYRTSTGTIPWADGGEGDGGFSVQTNQNYVVDSDKTFTASWKSNGDNNGVTNYDGPEGNMEPGRTGTATIHNTSTLPQASVGGDSKVEGNHLLIPVTLDHVYGQAVTVNWSTADITTEEAQDYTPASGTLTFNPRTCSYGGDTLQYIDITTVNDDFHEYNEDFKVTLAAGSNVTVPSGTETIATIIENDPIPAISINDVNVNEWEGERYVHDIFVGQE